MPRQMTTTTEATNGSHGHAVRIGDALECFAGVTPRSRFLLLQCRQFGFAPELHSRCFRPYTAFPQRVFPTNGPSVQFQMIVAFDQDQIPRCIVCVVAILMMNVKTVVKFCLQPCFGPMWIFPQPNKMMFLHKLIYAN